MSNFAKPPFPRLNRRHPLAQGLVFDASLHEGSGNKTFDTVNGLEGVLVASGATWQSHNYGHHLVASAAASQVNFTTPAPINGLTQVTLEFLVQRRGTGGGNYGRLFQKGTGASGYIQVYHNNDFAGSISFYLNRATTSGEWRTSTNALSANAWHRFVITYDATSTSNAPVFYLNGSVIATNQVVAPSGAVGTDNTSLQLLNRNDGTRNWAGWLAHARVWNRVLPADEVRQLAVDPYQIYQRRRRPKLVR